MYKKKKKQRKCLLSSSNGKNKTTNIMTALLEKAHLPFQSLLRKETFYTSTIKT